MKLMYILLDTASLVTQLDQIRGQIVGSKLAAFSSIAAVLAASLAAFYLIKFSHDYLQGEGVTLWNLIRPVVLVTVVSGFPVFVAGPLHGIVNLFTRSISNQVDVTMEEYFNVFRNIFKDTWDEGIMSIVGELDKAQAESSGIDATGGKLVDLTGGPLTGGDDDDKGAVAQAIESLWGKIQSMPSGLERFWDKIGEFLSSTFSTFFKMRMTWAQIQHMGWIAVINFVVAVAMKLLMFGQQILCYVHLALLGLIGPFVFALAVIQGFSSGINTWIARYVQVAMWIPVGQIVLYVNYFIMGNVLKFTPADGAMYLAAAMSLASLVSVKSVPQICSYVIESSGMNQAHRNVNGFMRWAANTAMTAAGLKR
jgi:hypothetical protein